MSGVKRYIPEGYTQPASRSGTGTHMVESRDGDYVLASDYDALAQRCKELDACMSEPLNILVRDRYALRAEVERLQRELAIAHADASRHASRAEELRGELQEERSTAESVRFSAWRHGDFLSVRDLLGMFCSDGIAGVDQAGMEHVARKAADEVEQLRRQVARHERQRAEVERLREIREIASQCAANGGYLNSQDLIYLRELLRR